MRAKRLSLSLSKDPPLFMFIGFFSLFQLQLEVTNCNSSDDGILERIHTELFLCHIIVLCVCVFLSIYEDDLW